MRLRVEPLTGKLGPAWDGVVATSPETWIFHDRAFLSLEEIATGSDYLAAKHFLVLDDDSRVLAICPAVVARVPFPRWGRWRRLFVGLNAAGPARARGLSRQQRVQVDKCIFDTVKAIAREAGCVDIFLSLAPLAEAYRHPAEDFVNPHVLWGFDDRSYLGKVINLNTDEEILFSRFDKGSRSAIKKAMKAGCTVRRLEGSEGLTEWYRMYRETFLRTGGSPLTESYWRQMWTYLNDGGGERFFAYQGGRVVAGAIILCRGGAALYWAGSSTPEALTLGANNLVQWELMRWLRRQGVTLYQIGETPKSPDYHPKFRAIGDFKDSFGGDYRMFPIASMTLQPVKMAAFNLVHEIVRALRRQLRRARRGARNHREEARPSDKASGVPEVSDVRAAARRELAALGSTGRRAE